MDKRIAKTKKLIKIALFELLSEEPFHKITVTDICDRACTSRITFYTHYDDKYDLLNEIAGDIKSEILERFHILQNTFNPENDNFKRHYNFIDALMDIEEAYASKLHQNIHSLPQEMQLSIYKYIKEISYEIETQYDQINPAYPSGPFSAFLTAGLWTYIGEAELSGTPKEQIRRDVKALLKNLLESSLFV